MKNLSISQFRGYGCAVILRTVFVLSLIFSVLGPGQNATAQAISGTFRVRFNHHTPFPVTNGTCILTNADYPGGKYLGVQMEADETYKYPATVTCNYNASSGTGLGTYIMRFNFHQVPVNSYIDWQSTYWVGFGDGYKSDSGQKTPDGSGRMEITTVVDAPFDEVRTASIQFEAHIEGGYETETLCAETFAVTTPIVQGREINPTIETPTGQPWDEQIVDLTPKNPVMEGLEWTYKLVTEGGWSDPSEYQDNTKYEISLDYGVTWTSLSELDVLLCKDSTGWIFKTDSDELRIRADDEPLQEPSWFADNLPNVPPFPIYSLYNAEQVNPTCADKFKYDPVADYVTNGILYADNALGDFMPPNWTGQPGTTSLIPGDWYAIETMNGPWYNNGEESYDIAVDFYDTVWGDQVEFGEWKYTDCWEYVDESETYKRYYFQAPEQVVRLHVNDLEFVFTDNTGRISYKLYHVPVYVYWPSFCDRQFVINDTVSITEVQATAGSGLKVAETAQEADPIPVPVVIPDRLTPGQWYSLETMEGPWRGLQAGHGGYINRWKMDIKRASWGIAPDYSFVPDWPDAHCVSDLDKVGHVRVYFQVPHHTMEDGGVWDVNMTWQYFMRVSGGNDLSKYAQNNGSMKVKISQVTRAQVKPPGDDPGEDVCDGTYKTNGMIAHSNVMPSSITGTIVPGILLDGLIYAIETTGYWDEGSGWNTRAQISDNNGATWYDWQDYPGLLCVEVFLVGEKLQYRIFFKKTPGLFLKVRADDGDSNWGNNANFSYGIKVYDSLMLTDPWNTCKDNYKITHIPVPPNIIPATLETGVRLPTVAGRLYAVEIYDGSWKATTSGQSRYDAAISTDSGSNFFKFSNRSLPGFQCYALIGRYEWVYFIAQDAYTQLMVNDNGELVDNTGQLKYRFYSAIDKGTPGDPIVTPPPGEYIGCYGNNIRPGTFLLPSMPARAISGVTGWDDFVDLVGDTLDWIGLAIRYTFENAIGYVGAWMSYVFGSIVSFFLWCPEHTAAIKAIVTDMISLEPFATIRRAMGFGELIKSQVESYSWSMNNGAAVPFRGIAGGMDVPSLMPAMEDTPFGGADIQWTPIDGGGIDGIASCDAHIVYRWGRSNPLVVGYCTVLSVLKHTGMNVILNIGIALSSLVMLFNYFRKRWVMTIISMITGGSISEATGSTTKVEIIRK